jgi:aspartate/methionine/tyrosine aminotransferase
VDSVNSYYSFGAKLKLDEEQFAARLLAEKGVAVVPGGYFGNNGRGHVRLTFVSEPNERIETGIRRIAEFVSTREKPELG